MCNNPSTPETEKQGDYYRFEASLDYKWIKDQVMLYKNMLSQKTNALPKSADSLYLYATISFYVYSSLPCVCIYALHASIDPEARKGDQIPWKQSYMQVLATMWVLGFNH